MSTAFTAGEQGWQARLGKLRDVVRQELVARQLARELPPAPVRLIDLGCGQGTQALRLARAGYDVTGVDASASKAGHRCPVTGSSSIAAALNPGGAR